MTEEFSKTANYQLPQQAALPLFDVTEVDAIRAKPFLRWVGGKTRLLSAILPHVPAKFKNYHEPFLGSGAMYFALAHRAKLSYLSDLNSELVNLWTVVRDEPRQLFDQLRPYHSRQGEDEYYVVRDESPDHHLERAARFFYLNQTAWNGLWRENKFGVFNVPYGARAFKGISLDVLDGVSSVLRTAIVENIDFRAALKRAKKGDLVYLDPPYLPISDTSKFAGYNGTRFRMADLEELGELCADLTKRGVHWIASNRDVDYVREIFSHATLMPFTTRRSVAAQNKRNVQPKDSPEIIIVGGPAR